MATFGVTVPIYPTPNILDTIEIETVVGITGEYSPLPYGTFYKDVPHSVPVRDLPEHILVADEAGDKEGKTRRRTWVNLRTDQDLYNFQINYENNDPKYPIYLRTYVLPRNGYSPLPALTKDSMDPSAFLVEERLEPKTEPESLGTQFVKVTRVFHTLPGKLLSTIEYPYGGLTDYPRVKTKQKVAAGNSIPQKLGAKSPMDGFQNAILISQEVQNTENGSIDEVMCMYEITPPEQAQIGFGYQVGYYGSEKDFPFVSWKFSALKDTYHTPAMGTPCPIQDYEHLVLVDEKYGLESEQSLLLQVQRRYEKIPGLIVWQLSYDNNDTTYPVIKSAQRKFRKDYKPGHPGTDPCPIVGYDSLLLFEQHMMPTDFYAVVEDQRVYERSPNGIVITHDFDPDMNVFVQTTRQKVVSGKVPIADKFMLNLQEQPVDRWRTQQIITMLREIPPDKVEHQTGKYAFPTLLTGIALQKVELTSETNSEVIWYPNTLRPLQNVPAVFRITTKFFTDRPPNIDVFVLPTRDVVFKGRSFDINISNVLCDPISLSVSFNGDTKYGDLTEGITFEPTNPSATDYYRSIGSLQTVGVDITRLRGSIWVLQLTEVVLA